MSFGEKNLGGLFSFSVRLATISFLDFLAQKLPGIRTHWFHKAS